MTEGNPKFTSGLAKADAAVPILKLRDVRKSYGPLLALDGVSMTVAPGQFVGLLGPNGAGKSTLFQIISGLFLPDSGTVELFGTTYRKHSRDILRRIGVVFQARSIDLEMTVMANLRFHGGLFGLWGPRLKKRIEEVADQLDFRESLPRPVRTLSGGNQRRVEIARALLNNPQFLLMDEPTVGLDASSRRELLAHIRDIRDRTGASILWATHLVDEVAEADRIVLISTGKVIADDTPQGICAKAGIADLTDAYVALTRTRTTTDVDA